MKINHTHLTPGQNIKTEGSFYEDKTLYTTYLIHRVMPKMVDYSEIWHIDHGLDHVERRRVEKSLLIAFINANETIHTTNEGRKS